MPFIFWFSNLYFFFSSKALKILYAMINIPLNALLVQNESEDLEVMNYKSNQPNRILNIKIYIQDKWTNRRFYIKTFCL